VPRTRFELDTSRIRVRNVTAVLAEAILCGKGVFYEFIKHFSFLVILLQIILKMKRSFVSLTYQKSCETPLTLQPHRVSLKSTGYWGELGHVYKGNINPHSHYTNVFIISCKTAVSTHIRKKKPSSSFLNSICFP
jgi:hypothetical protein